METKDFNACSTCNKCTMGGWRPDYCPINKKGPFGDLAAKGSSMANIQAKKKYVGVTYPQECGFDATIIEYNTFKDVAIRFNDEAGTVKRHMALDNVQKGKVTPYEKPGRFDPDKYLGKSFPQKCGLVATFIEITDEKYVIRWEEDGAIESFPRYKRTIPQMARKGQIPRKDLNLQNEYRDFHGFYVLNRKRFADCDDVKFLTESGEYLTAKEMIAKGA